MERKRRAAILVAAAVVCVFLSVGSLLVIRTLRNRVVSVGVSDLVDASGEFARLVADMLESVPPESLETRIAATPVRRIRVYLDGPRGANKKRDTLLVPAEGADSDAPIIAYDPCVIVSAESLGATPLADPVETLAGFQRWLVDLVSDGPVFVVAGDEPVDFAAFVLYLSGELLEPAVFLELVDLVTPRSPIEESANLEESQIGRLIDEIGMVLSTLASWKSNGILAYNWTDWDSIAVADALDRGDAVTGFLRRSRFDELSRQTRLGYAVYRPPSGLGRRSYRMTGSAVALIAGDGDRNDNTDLVASLLFASHIQQRIETDTGLTPARLEGAPVNREHRDIVRWISGAERFYSIGPEIAAHPLFRRLHQLLR